jgi:Peptidase inhibitor family I36
MLRKLVVGLATIVAAVAFSPTVAATANAESADSAASLAPEITTPVEPAISTCEATYLCFWVGNEYTGSRGRVSGDNPTWTRFAQPNCPSGTWNDCASSAKNRGTSCTAHVYSDVDYRGTHHAIGRGGDRPFLAFYWLNDAISSNRWC